MARTARVIDADRAQVWSVIADGWSYSNWVVGTSHMRAVETDWPARGSRLFHASGSWPLVTRDETEVEDCEPGYRLDLTARGRPFGEARVQLELADVASGCRITMTETPTAGPGRWMHNPVLELLLVRRNVESLDRLAAVSERRTVPEA